MKGLKNSFFCVLHDENAKNILTQLATFWSRVYLSCILKMLKALRQLMSSLLRQCTFVAMLVKACNLPVSARKALLPFA